MRFLVVGPDLNYVGGVAIYCRSLLAALPANTEYFAFEVGLRGNIRATLRMFFGFCRAIFKSGSAVVQLNTSLNNNALVRDLLLQIICKIFGKRTIVLIHGWDEEYESSLTGIRRTAVVSGLNSANKILVLGSIFAKRLRELGVTGDIEVATPCYPTLLDGGPSRVGNPRVGNLVYISRLVPEKGIHLLIDAFERLAHRHTDIRLHIAGDGPEMNRVINRIASSPFSARIRYYGVVDGVEKLTMLNEGGIFCFPSSYGEGLPIAILEALKCGLAIVSTRCGGVPDILEDERNCLFVDPSVGDLCAKLERLVNDREMVEQMGRLNQSQAERYSAASVAKNLMRMVKEVAD